MLSSDVDIIGRHSEGTISEAAKTGVRRHTHEVQGQNNFAIFDELFADNFVAHTAQPGTTPDKEGIRKPYGYLREALPDFHAEIHWRMATA
jgi:hypothetical protein